MFKKMLPAIFRKNDCIERRMREFSHSFDALMDDCLTYELNEEEVNQVIDIVRNSKKNWEVEFEPKLVEVVYQWIMKDKEYYVSVLEEFVDDDEISMEEFENLVMFPELTISSKDSPGGEYLTPIDMLHAFIMHDVHNPENTILRYNKHHKYSSCDIIFYLRFINNVENHYPKDSKGPYTREMYFNDIFENKDLLWGISKGALEVEFETYDNAYLREYFLSF